MYSSFSNKFRQIKPYDNYNVTDVPWHEAMVAGNGRLGVLESCAPIEDSLIYQNVEFVMPSEEPRHVPYDVTAQLDEARQAVINRNRENKGKDDTASHGWIHKALVEARLKNADAVYDTLNLLVHSDIFYTTSFTDHNTDRSKGVYCTDTAFGLVGIINEMLVYSDEHTIELLPAWSDKLGSGMVKGLRTRCGITIDELKWDVDKKKVYVSLDWGNADEINIVCGKYEIEKIGHEVKA